MTPTADSRTSVSCDRHRDNPTTHGRLTPDRLTSAATAVSCGALATALVIACSAIPTAAAQSLTSSSQRQQASDQFRINGGSLVNVGQADLDISVATRRGGAVTTAPGRTPGSTAMAFPDFDPAKKGERAAVVVRNAAGGDALNPGKRSFTFGADFWLNSGATVSDAASSGDRGDNVIQRGLFDDETQYKIEADGGRVDCRVTGRSGSVFAKISPPRIDRKTWYRAACTRDGKRVTLSLTDLSTGTSKTKTAHAFGATGDMSPGSAALPLSIGAKLAASGNVSINSSDQFNGMIANAFLNISAQSKNTTINARVNKTHPRKHQRVRFFGTLQPKVSGARVSLAFRATGTHGFKVLRTAKVNSDSSFRFKKVRVGKSGKYRVAFAGNSSFQGSKDIVRFRHHQFKF